MVLSFAFKFKVIQELSSSIYASLDCINTSNVHSLSRRLAVLIFLNILNVLNSMNIS